MKNKEERLGVFHKNRLYPVLSPEFCNGKDPLEVAKAVLKGGAKILQLRIKQKTSNPATILATAQKLRKITHDHNALLIINDDLDLALQIEADGVHLGKTDLNHHLDRKALKSSTKDIILGFSASNIHEAVEAEADGADYLGVGPIFPTMTKTDFSEITGLINLEQICLQSHVPVVAIGGIKLENMGKVLACGVSHIAVISAICSQIDPEKATHHFLLNICQK